MGNEIGLIKTFFQISSFVFSRTNKHIEVWNNMRVSKYFHFWVNQPFQCEEASMRRMMLFSFLW